MALCRRLLTSIGRAVRDTGGTANDEDDLVRVWLRVEHDPRPLGDRLRYEAHMVRCCCVDGGEAMTDRRRERFGSIERRAA